MSSESERYELVTKKILENLRHHLRFDNVGGKEKYQGETGTEWEIDASCYRKDTDTLVLIECRRKTTRRIPQEEMAGFAFRIRDIGAGEGLMVTPIGYQKGAKKVAKAARIGMATLNPEATESEYILTIANRLFRGLLVLDHGTETDNVSVYRTCDACGSELITQDSGKTFFCPICRS